MENTIENKAKFFAQYWGQKVYGWYDGRKTYFTSLNLTDDEWLLLTPLQDITDEDAIEVFNVLYPNSLPVDNFEKIESVKEVFESDFRPHRFLDLKSSTSFIDCVRSKGYALPFMGLSVDELVAYGWVKLKTTEYEKQ